MWTVVFLETQAANPDGFSVLDFDMNGLEKLRKLKFGSQFHNFSNHTTDVL